MNQAIYLKDYRAPSFQLHETYLCFDLQQDCVVVESQLLFSRTSEELSKPLFLDGQELELLSLSVQDTVLGVGDYSVDDKGLTINALSINTEEKEGRYYFSVRIATKVFPDQNLALEGLYRSNGLYCTQCEAEGFRRITYYPDRPDVLSVFTTKIIADKEINPLLLANGNKVDSGELAPVSNGSPRHWVKWHDPFLKPCYLFALVAGDLAVSKNSFITCSGREVALEFYVEEKDVGKLPHAIQSLKNAMSWDEEEYGREYDLDLYMVVAVDFFNMGAMENKGLNIFNTSCVLADKNTQVDAAFQRVEAVVAHEYFHNWSGNRVTCRDWFQLSLKEGFTVFRDACFSADMNSETVKRIEDVNLMRSMQFAEDNGPLSHPVRPESFIEISNFYTLTIYEKGAEVIRMMQRLIGADNFRKGSDLYFERHDGQAATVEDFVSAMSDASGQDFSQFMRWYSQSGTPRLLVEQNWNDKAKELTLTLSQHSLPTPGQTEKAPFLIPVDIAFVDSKGFINNSEQVLQLTESEQVFQFGQFSERPTLSCLRGFSAPVKLEIVLGFEDLLRLLEYETDGYARWDASRRLIAILLDKTADGERKQLVERYAYVLKRILISGVNQNAWDLSRLDAAMIAEVLTMPSFAMIVEERDKVLPTNLINAYVSTKCEVATALQPILEELYLLLSAQLTKRGEYSPHADDIALRSLKNTCLNLLVCAKTESSLSMLAVIEKQYRVADNMTDRMSALNTLVARQVVEDDTSSKFADLLSQLLTDYLECYKNDALAIDQWLALQSGFPSVDALEHVKQLAEHEVYDATNPNKIRALVGGFAMRNFVGFHRDDGAGYEFLADEVIRLDKLNPQIASRLLTPLAQWRKFEQDVADKMRLALKRVVAEENLSPDVYEVASKSA